MSESALQFLVFLISLEPIGGISPNFHGYIIGTFFVVQSMVIITNHGLSMVIQWLAIVTIVKSMVNHGQTQSSFSMRSFQVILPILGRHISLGAESRKKSYAKHFGYKLATGLHLKKNDF